MSVYALLAALGFPLMLCGLCSFSPCRHWVIRALFLAPLPAFLAVFWITPDGLISFGTWHFELDGPGRMLLVAAALLWMAAGRFVSLTPKLYEGASGILFPVCWLLSLTGCLGVMIAADVWSFLVMFSLAGLPAYFLVAQDGTEKARQAAAVFAGFALAAEAALVLGFALMTVELPELNGPISRVVSALTDSPWRNAALVFVVAGFGMKMGFFPVHFWLPLAHPAAPAAASAVLSGVLIKSGVIGLIRFLPLETADENWGTVLATLGLITAFYGVVVGITQKNPKVVLAYSSVSQMGFVAAMLGVGWSAGDPSVANDAAFYAMHHVFAKGALFLAVGIVAVEGYCRRWLVLAPSVLIALGMAGLPFTGGALAKMASKNFLGSGLAETFASISAASSAMLMLHFLRCMLPLKSEKRSPAVSLLIPFLGLVVAGFIVRWMVYLRVGFGDFSDPFAWKNVWASMLPIAVGALAFLGITKWENLLPKWQAGDIGIGILSGIFKLRSLGFPVAVCEASLRRWTTATAWLVAFAFLLGLALIAR